ncbi:hypothetical protein [Archangium lansingense]|uniref:DUF3108 domain-containing protein n=1 Tax=Archangium lansingense TaxID=2995310 RepID=A0ABT4AIA2_9BACT|nr:hypothetical protein [Archangium lansinium]MCY1080634.1 hypothetical protein [Archangium lansinium]
MSVGLSLLCGASVAAEPSPGDSPQRVTPAGGLFSIEFPAAPTCNANPVEPDCHYVYPSEGWVLSASLSQVESSEPPARSLEKQLNTSAEDGSFRIVRQEITHVGDLPALDYRFESTDESAYRAVGRLVLIGARIVTLEVGGDTLPSEDAIQRFMNTFRVEGQPGKSEAVVSSAPEPQPSAAPSPTEPAEVPQRAQASSASLQSEPSLQSITARMQASLLKPGKLQYQSIQEKLPGEGMPWSFSVGTAKRIIQRKRDKKRDALIIIETGRTQAGTFEHRFWLDAKTLLPYRWTSRSPGSSTRLEVIDGFLHADGKGASAVKFNQHLGDTPLLFPGAPLELALSTLPLAPGFTGSVRVLDPGGMATGKPFSTWRVSVPFAGPVTGLARLKKDVASYKVELLESTGEKELEKAPRKIILWIESEARRVLQVETEAPLSRGGIRSVQTLQAQR